MKKLLNTTLCGMLITTGAVAQVIQKGNTYSVIAKYKPGQVTNMTMSVKSSVKDGGPGNTTINARTKVISVAKDGSATIDVFTPAFGGRPASTQRMIIDKYGRPKGNNLGAFSGNFSWPTYPVKIGESWSGDINLSGGQGAPPIPLKATYKFVGTRSVSGIKVAVVNAKIDISSLFDMKGVGEMLIRFDDGQLYESNLNMSMTAPDAKTKKPSKVTMYVSVKNRR